MSIARLLAIVVCLTAACLLAGNFAPGQDKQDKKDPQSTFEPRSKPGAGQKLLEKFVGEWDVVKSFYPQSGQPSRTTGACRQTMIQEGRFLQSDFTFGQGAAKTTGQGLIGYEGDTGLFTSVWIDSRRTEMSLRQSKDKFNGEEIVLFSKSLQDGGKAARVSRTVTRLEDNAGKIVHRQFNLGQDGKERLMMELLMTRKEKAG
jgi:hypothetical protein